MSVWHFFRYLLTPEYRKVNEAEKRWQRAQELITEYGIMNLDFRLVDEELKRLGLGIKQPRYVPMTDYSACRF